MLDAHRRGDRANEASRLLRNAGFRAEDRSSGPDGLITAARGRPGHGTLDIASSRPQRAYVLCGAGQTGSRRESISETRRVSHHRKAMRSVPIRRRDALPAPHRAPAPLTTDVTSFAPIIQEMVDQVSGAALIQTIGEFSGRGSVNVGGVSTTFTTRSSQTALCDKAEQLVYERFQALGYTDVQYDPFSFSSSCAKVIAPRSARDPDQATSRRAPDSTSPSREPAPGATTMPAARGLLMVRDIRDYSLIHPSSRVHRRSRGSTARSTTRTRPRRAETLSGVS